MNEFLEINKLGYSVNIPTELVNLQNANKSLKNALIVLGIVIIVFAIKANVDNNKCKKLKLELKEDEATN